MLFYYLYQCDMPVYGLKIATGIFYATISEQSEFIRQIVVSEPNEQHMSIDGIRIDMKIIKTKV